MRESEDAFIFHRVTWGVKWRLCCEFFLLYVSKKNLSVVLLMEWGFVLTLTLMLLLLFAIKLNLRHPRLWSCSTKMSISNSKKPSIFMSRDIFLDYSKKKKQFLCSLNRSRSKSWLSGTATRCSAWMFCLSCSCCHLRVAFRWNSPA